MDLHFLLQEGQKLYKIEICFSNPNSNANQKPELSCQARVVDWKAPASGWLKQIYLFVSKYYLFQIPFTQITQFRSQ
jgi:hypothetical protein